MKKAVMCIVADRMAADTLVGHLQRAGFANTDISVVAPGDFTHETHTKAPEGAIAGVGAGGVLGGTLGLLAGIGALAIPGLGPLIAAGPLLAAMTGVAAGATVGGVTGALVGMGIPEIEAKRYEGRLRSGGVLVSVHCNDADQVRRAETIVKQYGGQDVTTTFEGPRSTRDAAADIERPSTRHV